MLPQGPPSSKGRQPGTGFRAVTQLIKNKYLLPCRSYGCCNTFGNGAFLMIKHFCKATFNVLHSCINFTFHTDNPRCQGFFINSAEMFFILFFLLFLLSNSHDSLFRTKSDVPSSASLKYHKQMLP